MARSAVESSTRAGTIDTSRMPSTCRFSATGHGSIRPSAVRATITLSSTSKSQQLFDHAGHATEFRPRAVHRRHVSDATLALAVVAEPSGLHDRPTVDDGGDDPRSDHGLRFVEHQVRPDGEPVVDEELLLGDAVLGDPHRRR